MTVSRPCSTASTTPNIAALIGTLHKMLRNIRKHDI